MREEGPSFSDSGKQPTLPVHPYALDVSIGGSFEERHSLRRDKPTWTGRRPNESCADFDYIKIPGSLVRWHCLFEWDATAEQFRVTVGPWAAVWINAEDVGSGQRRLLNDGDVVIVSGVNRGRHCVRLTLVRCES